jgi:multicomponent Na+:H+ antiporter subunit D
MIEFIPPAFIYIVGALLVPLLRGRVKSFYMLLLPLISFIFLINTQVGTAWEINFLGFELVPFKVDRLSLVFSYIFHLVSLVGIIYTLSIRSNLEYVAALVYAGSALGVVFAGDLFTFFVFWEMLTVSALWLIWARRTKASQAAGFRYLMVHVFGGLVLLAGIIMYISEQKSISLGFIGLHSPATYFIFIGMGINAAWPLLHSWLTDAYPESTVGGAVLLSAFTTKTAVYALARTFPGTESLIWIGVTMAVFPIFYAIIENNLRRVLSYSLINPIGFMMVGIGIGTELSINGAAAYAFAHILYKSLLFMSMGAVMFRTGKINATDLGGLYKSMPLTALFCTIGALSISTPLTGGFVSKSMVLDAAAHGHMGTIWLILLFASAGIFLCSGIKIVFFAFFSRDAGHQVEEAPPSMLVAMGIMAFFCIFIGVYPKFLYSILPYPVDFVPYTASHILFQLQLLMFSALAFTLLLRSGIYPAEIRAINLDADLIYRKGSRLFYQVMDKGLNAINKSTEQVFVGKLLVDFTRFVREAPSKLLVEICTPFWKTDTNKADPKAAREKLLKRAQSGFYPISIMGLFAAIYFALLFLLYITTLL